MKLPPLTWLYQAAPTARVRTLPRRMFQTVGLKNAARRPRGAAGCTSGVRRAFAASHASVCRLQRVPGGAAAGRGNRQASPAATTGSAAST